MLCDVLMLLFNILLVFTLGTAHTSHGRLTVTISDELDEKVEDIEKKLIQLTERLGAIEKAIDVPAGGNVADVDAAEETEETQPAYPVTILSVRIEPFSSQFANYRVRFLQNLQNVVVKCLISGFQLRNPEIIVQDSEGVYEAWIFADDRDENKGYGAVLFMFYDTDTTIGVEVTLQRPNATDALDHHSVSGKQINIPKLDVTPAHSMIYQKGHDVDFVLVVDRDRFEGVGENKFHHVMFVQPYLYDLNTKETISKFSEDLLLNHHEPNPPISTTGPQSIYETHWKTLKTSTYNVSGFIMVQAYSAFGEGSLVYSLSAVRFIEVKPNTQQHPFPRDALAFVKNEDDADIEKVKCYENSVNGVCIGRCKAIGGNISEITVKKISQNRTALLVKSWNYLRENDPFMRHVVFNIPVPGEGEDKQPQNFVCSAYSKNGLVTTKSVLMEFQYPISFVSDETYSRIEEHENYIQSLITLKCTVKGHPPPAVYLAVKDKHGHFIVRSYDVGSVISRDGLQRTVEMKTYLIDIGRAYCSYHTENGDREVYDLYEYNAQSIVKT